MAHITKFARFATTKIGSMLTMSMLASLQITSGLQHPSLFWLFSGVSYMYALWMYLERHVSQTLALALCATSLFPVLMFGPTNPF